MALTMTLPTDTIRVVPDGRLSDAEFLLFCQQNPELHIEREADGTLSITSPLSLLSGNIEAKFITALGIYAEKYGGEAYSSSTGFTLPDTSVKSPDASYLKPEKVDPLTEAEKNKFTHIVPDFVVEVRSKTDRLRKGKRKMEQTWMANGVPLGWLVDAKNQRIHVYRINREAEVLEGFERTLTGAEILPEFSFDFRKLLRRLKK